MLSGFIKINIWQARTLINHMQLGLQMTRKREALGKLKNAQRLDIGKMLYEVKIEITKTYRIPKNRTGNG